MTDDQVGVVGYRFDDGVAVITLQRTNAANALDRPLKEALLAALRRASEDPAVRAVLLTGKGRAFCVGQDLGEHAEALRADPSTALETVRQHYNPIVLAIAHLRVPVVVAINGACVGAGLGFAMAGDLRVAAEGAKFGTAFTGIGLSSDSGLAASLVHTVGAGRASELFLLGDSFTAAEALSWGIVHRVVPDDELADHAGQLARRLAAGPTAAYAEVKAALRSAATNDLASTLAMEADAQERLALTDDHRGAVESFLAKQRPTFTGR